MTTFYQSTSSFIDLEPQQKINTLENPKNKLQMSLLFH